MQISYGLAIVFLAILWTYKIHVGIMWTCNNNFYGQSMDILKLMDIQIYLLSLRT